MRTKMGSAVEKEEVWKQKDVILFGASSGADLFLKQNNNILVKGLVDNDIKKIGKKKFGLEIKHPKSLVNNNNLNNVVIVVTSMYYDAISKQLKDYGFYENIHFFYGFKQSMIRIACSLDNNIGLEKIFCSFNQHNIEYVILRNFDQLPNWQNKDIDLLVKEKDIDKIKHVKGVHFKPEGIMCEVYSSSGQGDGIPYYPVELASLTLQRRTLYKNNYFVPNKEDYFYTLIYHVVYHKVEDSLLPESYISLTEQKKLIISNRYAKVIYELARELGIENIELTLSGLNRLLKEKEYSPSIDLLRKLSLYKKSDWLEKLAKQYKKETTMKLKGEVMVFIIREWAVTNNKVKIIEEMLKDAGLKILTSISLEGEMKNRAVQKIRGGNWGDDVWGNSGGEPAIIVIGYDAYPIKPNKEQSEKNKYLSNQRYLIKRTIREKVNKSVPKNKKVNFIHSSDDNVEAFEYIKTISKELNKKIIKEIEVIEGL